MADADYDSPWKEILTGYLPEFLAFFFPTIHGDIDWNQKPEFLDKELQKIAREGEVGRRSVDKLVKVWLRQGREQWVLIHIEVQASRKADFEERLYTYHYRIFDRYKRSTATLAILTDGDKSWRPNFFQRELWGCYVRFGFNMVKLLDYGDSKAELATSANPFAVVVQAHLAILASQTDGQSRLQYKVALIRELYDRGWSKQRIIDLYWFLDWVIALPDFLVQEYNQAVEQIEQERQMRYVTSMERQGIEKGVQQGEFRLLHRQLIRRFGPLPATIEERLQQAQPEQLENWGEALLDAQSLDDLFGDD
jgi:hypothetical protein